MEAHAVEAHASYRVVGVRPDGERVVIFYALTHAEADRLIKQATSWSPFDRLVVEFKYGGKWPSACQPVEV